MSHEQPYHNQTPSTYPQHAAGPPKRRGTNGFAIAALVLSLFGGVLLAVIFGIVALVQVRKSGQSGKGLAIAGLVISGLWVVALGIGVALAIGSDAERDASGNVTEEGSVQATQLRPGDCIRDMKESTQIYNLPAVPCTQPHQGEVFAVFTLPAGDWPGDQKVTEKAQQGCQSRLAGYSKKAAENDKLEMFFLYPSTATAWRQDRGVTCIVTDPRGNLTKSLRD